MSTNTLESLLAKLNTSGGPDACHTWTMSTDKAGYGRASFQGKPYRVHRLVYMLATGNWLTPDIKVRHTCDNPPCANLAHLISGTPQQNADDMVARKRSKRYRTTCKNGHTKTPENTYINPTSGAWCCRDCQRNYSRQQWALDESVKTPCSVCGAVMAKKSLPRHTRRMHKEMSDG